MTTNDTRTASMLRRVPEILAVTAHSYGLAPQDRAPRQPGAPQRHGGHRPLAATGKAR